MNRIVLKISGEAFVGDGKSICPESAQKVAQMVANIQKSGMQLVIVVGGGNIYRGSKLISEGLRAADSHNMSMLSTVFNALTLKNFLEKEGLTSHVLDALHVEFLEHYRVLQAREYLQRWEIVICTGGIGVPFFSTDSTGVIRALELECDAMIKATKVDGIYTSDPMTDPNAQKIQEISYNDFLQKNLKVLDGSAVILARDNSLPIFVCKFENTALKQLIENKTGASKIF